MDAPCDQDGRTQLYGYVLLYIDDCLVASDNTEFILRKEIGRYFELKPMSIGPPSFYLGGHLRKVKIDEKKGEQLKAKASGPLPREYRPEIDVSDELGSDEASYFQSLIGVLRLMV